MCADRNITSRREATLVNTDNANIFRIFLAFTRCRAGRRGVCVCVCAVCCVCLLSIQSEQHWEGDKLITILIINIDEAYTNTEGIASRGNGSTRLLSVDGREREEVERKEGGSNRIKQT